MHCLNWIVTFLMLNKGSNMHTMTYFWCVQFINLHVLTLIADADAMATAEIWEWRDSTGPASKQKPYQHHVFLLKRWENTQRMDESVLLDLLECPVCLERLDASAKVLPCQHTFCRRCLQGILGSRGELRCPECRTLVECAVDELPSNILLVRLLDGIKQRPRRAGPGAGVCTNGTSGAVARAHSSATRDQGTPGAQPQRAQAKSTLVRVSILTVTDHGSVSTNLCFPLLRSSWNKTEKICVD